MSAMLWHLKTKITDILLGPFAVYAKISRCIIRRALQKQSVVDTRRPRICLVVVVPRIPAFGGTETKFEKIG